VTHRGLTDADTGCRARNAPVGEQRIEMNEEIEVDATQIDGIDTHYRSYLFDRGS
jgi:hypothetical protein